ncbi:hypothetical protein VTJ49DRAFT_7195 [Mycothermus thermophilus]|uniref:Amidoligase enzyme n=1 Tax=Humicola insolens TaxID=85995 RepID=A0ABR3VQL1_HUMIN
MPHITFVPSEPGHHRVRFDGSEPPSPRTGTHHHHRTKTHHEKTARRVEPPDFRFCVELGLVIRSRKRDHKAVTGLQDEISDHLTRAGIANHVASSSRAAVNPREWTIASEVCIPSHPRDHRFGMKLVSPFMRFSKRAEAWQADIRTVLRTLNAHFELTTSHQCFTHIHIVPATGYWELDQAKGLAKSALYFERCLDELVPPYRRKSVWAKSNRNNFYFLTSTMPECFAIIDAQTTFEGLGARMNWTSAASPTGRALGAQPGADFQHDAFRWSFVGLNEGSGFGTVAFRQPPGSTSASEVIGWVMLVGCLARLSCGAGGGLKPEQKPQLKSLGEWLLYEAEWCAMPHKSPLKDLLKQAVSVTPVPGTIAGMDADVITIDEDQRLKWKINDRNLALDKYRRLITA